MDDIPAYSDQFLLIALKEGQEKAFDFIFRRHYKALCAQANARVQDPDLAQSLVQDCFIRLWEIRERATEIEALPSWLSVTVRNRCIDHLRKQKKESGPEAMPIVSRDDQETDASLLSREFEEKLVQTLSELPARCRSAFEYSRFEGLTYQETASRMSISVKAVEALIGRALKILRTGLKDYLPLVPVLLRIICP